MNYLCRAVCPVFLSVAMVVSVTSCASDHDVPVRYSSYADFDHSQPETAFASFMDAFTTGDFANALHLVHPETQRIVFRDLNNFDPSVGTAAVNADVLAALSEMGEDASHGEFVYAAWHVMATRGGLRVDISRGVTDVDWTEVRAGHVVGSGRLVVDDSPVEVEMGQNSRGDWRVVRFTLEGADPERVLFGGPADGASEPVDPTALVSGAERLDNTTAEAALAQFERLVDAGDYFGMLYLFAPETRGEISRALNRTDLRRFLPEASLYEYELAFERERDFLVADFVFEHWMEEIGSTGLKSPLTGFTIERSKESVDDLGRNRVDVQASVAGFDGSVTIVLVEQSPDRWFVRSILGPGADPTLLPFG